MDGLPDELLEKIFHHLDLETKHSAQNVCQRWNRILRSDRFYRRVVVDEETSYDSFVNILNEHAEYMVAIHLIGRTDVDKLLDAVCASGCSTKLNELRIKRCSGDGLSGIKTEPFEKLVGLTDLQITDSRIERRLQRFPLEIFHRINRSVNVTRNVVDEETTSSTEHEDGNEEYEFFNHNQYVNVSRFCRANYRTLVSLKLSDIPRKILPFVRSEWNLMTDISRCTGLQELHLSFDRSEAVLLVNKMRQQDRN